MHRVTYFHDITVEVVPDGRTLLDVSVRERIRTFISCKNLDLTSRTMSDFAIHRTADIIGEADWLLSRTRALLAPAQPVLGILDNGDPLAQLAAKR
jgi:hypothetical protein